MKFLLTCFGMLIIQTSFAQITSPKPQAPAVEIIDIPDTTPPRKNSIYTFYLGAGRNNSFRRLTSNDYPYGKALGYRADEEHLKVWSYEAGIRTKLSEHLQLDAGLSLARSGEKYKSVPTDPSNDSAYAYENRYAFVSIPIQIYGTIGDDFKLYGGGGFETGIVAAYNKELTLTDSIGNSTTTKTNTPEALAGIILSARLSGGIQWKWNKNFGLYVNYTYQFGLTSTYAKQDPYKHYIHAGGVRFGMYFNLPE